MYRFFVLLAATLFLGANAQADETLDNNKIYFFSYDGCPYCRKAEEHIAQKQMNLNMEKVDIYKPGGMYLFKQCAQKFNLGRNVGTPLFCMGDTYLMGWSEENQKQFDELSRKFQK